MKFNKDWLQGQLLDRFLRYVRIETTSDRHSDDLPSTPGQWDLLRMLERELRELPLADVDLNEDGFLIAGLPASKGFEHIPVIGFMAHVDTTQEVTAHEVRPQVHSEYDGNPIEIADGLVLSPENFPELLRYRGETIITTDGTTLLGADDKAGVAEIMTAVSWLVSHEEVRHGEIEIIFTPDEETGKGMDRFPVSKLRSKCCYTLDGDVEGSVEAECFNAYKAEISFTGKSIHPGTARGKLVNAVSMAGAFTSMLPRNESPEATDGRFGFYLPLEIKGDAENSWLSIYIRDFEMDEINRRLKALEKIGEAVESMFDGGSVRIETAKQYVNMRDSLAKNPKIVDLLIEAVKRTGIEPILKVIRGGTDGARLCEMGVPTPNIFTGGQNYHSRLEWAGLPTMAKAAEVIVHLAVLWAEQDKR